MIEMLSRRIEASTPIEAGPRRWESDTQQRRVLVRARHIETVYEYDCRVCRRQCLALAMHSSAYLYLRAFLSRSTGGRVRVLPKQTLRYLRATCGSRLQ